MLPTTLNFHSPTYFYEFQIAPIHATIARFYMTTHNTLSTPTPDQGKHSSLATPLVSLDTADTFIDALRRLNRFEGSFITAFLIYRSAIRTPRKGLKT